MDINHHQSEDTLELSFGCYSRKINVKCHQNDLISRKKCSNNNKWTLRKNRFHHRRKSSFLVLCWTSVLYLSLLPVPQNAMPVPKVEDHNSLTSAMVSTYVNYKQLGMNFTEFVNTYLCMLKTFFDIIPEHIINEIFFIDEKDFYA